MTELAAWYFTALPLISFKTWLLGAAWVLLAKSHFQMLDMVTGDQPNNQPVRTALGSAAKWPLMVPRWSLILWPFTFALYPLCLLYWLIVWPLFSEINHRQNAHPSLPDTVGA